MILADTFVLPPRLAFHTANKVKKMPNKPKPSIESTKLSTSVGIAVLPAWPGKTTVKIDMPCYFR
jgi:hypothetical protein